MIPILPHETSNAPARSGLSPDGAASPSNSIDAVITFRNGRGESERGTLVSCGRGSLVMELYNPQAVTQVSQVLRDLTLHCGTQVAYSGNATVNSLLNTGPMLVVSVSLTDEWQEFDTTRGDVAHATQSARSFVHHWNRQARIGRDFQLLASEMHAFLCETRRWANRIDMSPALPREDDGRRIRADIFGELAEPIVCQIQTYLACYEHECRQIAPEHRELHRHFAQSTLHPLLLQSPFVYRSFTKPLGYAGDFEIVNQILGDSRCGEGTYAQIVNTAFLAEPIAQAHRNRIDILVDLLQRHAGRVHAENRPLKVLNIGCGPATEIQRFIAQGPSDPGVEFTLVDFSDDALRHAREGIEAALRAAPTAAVRFSHVNASVQDLLRRASSPDGPLGDTPWDLDLVYCAGLFDYLSDKVCTRLLRQLAPRLRPGGALVATNVHACNPNRLGLEDLLEWHLIHRNEVQFEQMRPPETGRCHLYADKTGVNLFAEFHRADAEAGR